MMLRIGQRFLAPIGSLALRHRIGNECRTRIPQILLSSRFGGGMLHRNNISRFASSSSNDSSNPVSQKKPSPLDSGRYKLMTIPNAICVGRIVATPVVGYLVVQHEFPIAFGLFVAAGLTDMIDGLIARNVPGQKSLLGSVLDPIADKLLVSVMFVTMSYASLIPWQLTAVVLMRDVCLIVGGFYKRYRSMEPPYTLQRFFNPEVSSMQVVPSLMSKVNTVLQLSVIAGSLSIPVFSLGELSSQLAGGLYWITAFTTIYSGLQYASGRALRKI